jgi:hypothetical protein
MWCVASVRKPTIMPRQWALPALLGVLALAAAVAVVVLTAQQSQLRAEVALASGNGPLVSQLRALLAAKTAAAAQDRDGEHTHEVAHAQLAAAGRQWRSARPDWVPFNPSLSLTQNKLERQAAGDARETELNERAIVDRLATAVEPDGPGTAAAASGHRPRARARLERYQANMYNRHPKRACSDWGAHPIDCIREAYGNHLKGTKFAPLRRRYDGRVTETSLDHERNLISKKVSEGLIKGSIKAPKHDQAVTSWLHRVKGQMRAARKLAMQRALAARIKREERDADESQVAKTWGSGEAATGPAAGRRYYINYATGQTSFTAPRYVEEALKDIRLRKRAQAQRAVQHEAKLYEEGFRAAQRAMLVKGGRTMSLRQVPTTSLVGTRRAEQIHAEKAINNFLQKGGRHPQARAYTWKDLARERARVAHELGYKSLTHQKGRLPPAQHEQLGAQQKVIVDASGRPVTYQPPAADFPMRSAGGEHAAPGSGDAEAGAESSKDSDTSEAVAKAVASVTAAVKQKTGALQSEVSAQQAIIEDLERKVAEQTRVSARAQPQKTVMPLEPKPRLGSFEMAKFANNLGTGTNIVDVYDDLKEKADYAAVASRGGQLRSPKDFAAVRDQVARQVCASTQPDVHATRLGCTAAALHCACLCHVALCLSLQTQGRTTGGARSASCFCVVFLQSCRSCLASVSLLHVCRRSLGCVSPVVYAWPVLCDSGVCDSGVCDSGVRWCMRLCYR